MDIVINCKISLSKKLRGIQDVSADKLILVASHLVNGRGTGSLSLSFDGSLESLNLDPSDLGETSIIIEPIEIADVSTRMGGLPSGNLFIDNMEGKQTGQRTAIDRLAATVAPVKGDEYNSIVVEEEVVTPDAFKVLDTPEYQKWVSNLNELVDAVSTAKAKPIDSSIDLNQATNERERQIMIATRDQLEAIDIPAWIVNDKAATITVNDLEIDLTLNSPYNLSNISARRISVSKDLRGLINAGFVKFISPQEAEVLMGVEVEEFSVALDVFDSPAMAELNMERGSSDIIDATAPSEITSADLDGPTEEEGMILNLTQDMPTIKSTIPQTTRQSPSVVASASRTTSHGNVVEMQNLSGGIPNNSNDNPNKSKNSHIKTVRRL